MKKNKARQVKNCKIDLGKKARASRWTSKIQKESVQAKVWDKLKSLRRQSLHQRITKKNPQQKNKVV